MKPSRLKIRLSLMGRLLLCFAVGGVGINMTLWYGLTNSPPAEVLNDLKRAGPPPGMERPPSRPPGGAPPLGMERPPPGDMAQMPPHYGPIMMSQASEIIDRLEKTPTLEFGTKISREKYVDIRLDSPDGGWSTNEATPPWDELEPMSLPSPQNPLFQTGPRFVSHVIGHHRWTIFFAEDWAPGLLSDPRFRLLLIGQVSIVIAICFLFAVWQLRPLRSLRRGTWEVAQGNLDYQVPIEQESELGDLARTFNQMTAQVKGLMESKDELLAAISHELRSPLTRMKLALHVEGEKSLPRIHRNIDQMEKLIAELLESSRLDSGKTEMKTESFRLGDLLQEVAQSYAGQDPVIRVEETASHLTISGDRDRLGRVLVNLVENAIKYSGGSGKSIVLWGAEVRDGTELHVRDSGPGVPEELLGRIFEPFFRIDKSRGQAVGGYGLGLSLCRKIAAAHGGSIQARNVPAGGLEIIVFLPRTYPQQKAA